MTEQTINWLRETFGAALTIHTNEETGKRFIYLMDVFDLINARPLDAAHTIADQLWEQPGSATWLMLRKEDLPLLIRATREVRGQRNENFDRNGRIERMPITPDQQLALQLAMHLDALSDADRMPSRPSGHAGGGRSASRP
jgi:hypothetical protein